MTSSPYLSNPGVVGSFGRGIEPMWRALLTQTPGPSPVALSESRSARIGRVDLPGQSQRAERLASESAAQSVDTLPSNERERTGLVLATNGNFPPEKDEGGMAERVASQMRLGGPCLEVRSDCASAIVALQIARTWLRAELADPVLVVASSSMVDERSWKVLRRAGVIASGEQDGARPFAADRNGTCAAEGAASLLVSSQARAGALGRLLGVGLTLNAHHLVAPPTEGRETGNAVGEAFAQSGHPPRLACIVAHGTGTLQNDANEARGLRRVLGDALASVPITSLKATLGHSFAASGLFGVLAGLMALRTGELPGTGVRHIDPALGPLRVACQTEPLGPGDALTLAHGLGVLNGAALLGAVA